MFKKQKKAVAWVLLLSMIAGMVFSLTGCGATAKKEEEPIVIAQNDYAGAYSRITQIQNDVVNALSCLSDNNYQIQLENPNDYWAEDNYYFVHFLPVYTKELAYTHMLNEIDEWSAVEEYTENLLINNGYAEAYVSVKRDDLNQYTLQYADYFENDELDGSLYGDKIVKCIYDAENNRFKVESKIKPWGQAEYYKDYFYEFAEIGPTTYILQNNEERLYVKYEDGKISYFAYSSLTQFDEDEEISISTVSGNTISGNSSEDFVQIYDVDKHSMFYNMNNIDKEWVFKENGYYSEKIIYDSETVSVTTTNILTKDQNSFTIEIPKELETETELSTEEMISNIEETKNQLSVSGNDNTSVSDNEINKNTLEEDANYEQN